tara:strand:+ start:183 stop:539 length:357 start_codon:yes stop_codon:yes gene_type:complete
MEKTEYNNNFKYDLKIGQIKERELADIFQREPIEVKYDLKALDTGNVYVEYYSRGKKSGISTSEAKFYCFAFVDDTYHLIKTKNLKVKCREYINTSRDKKGGDNNTSKGILLPITDLL